MTYCPACGDEFADTKRFCRWCGCKLEFRRTDQNCFTDELGPAALKISPQTSEPEFSVNTKLKSQKDELIIEAIRKDLSREAGPALADEENTGAEKPMLLGNKQADAASDRTEQKTGHRTPFQLSAHGFRLMNISSVAVALLLLGLGLWMYTRYSDAQSINERGLDKAQIRSEEKLVRFESSPVALFETLKKANLDKDIDRFMSCYSSKFQLLNEKRLTTLSNWKVYDYVDLGYDIKGLIFFQNKSSGIIEWTVSVQPSDSKETISDKLAYQVLLERESEGLWKIVTLQKLD